MPLNLPSKPARYLSSRSRRLGDDLAKELNAVVAVEITRMPTFCERIRAALPSTATFKARRVDYYPQSQGGNPRWALPMILRLQSWKVGVSRRNSVHISLTDALDFENVKCQLSRRKTRTPAKPEEHLYHLLKVGNLRDICRLRSSNRYAQGSLNADYSAESHSQIVASLFIAGLSSTSSVFSLPPDSAI